MDAAFAALGEPKRREILIALSQGELAAGAIVDALRASGAISQPAVSQHLKVLREAGLVMMRADGTRRVYAVDHEGISAVIEWLAATISAPLSDLAQPLDALDTEVARGKRQRKTSITSKVRRSRSA